MPVGSATKPKPSTAIMPPRFCRSRDRCHIALANARQHDDAPPHRGRNVGIELQTLTHLGWGQFLRLAANSASTGMGATGIGDSKHRHGDKQSLTALTQSSDTLVSAVKRINYCGNVLRRLASRLFRHLQDEMGTILNPQNLDPSAWGHSEDVKSKCLLRRSSGDRRRFSSSFV